MKIEIQIPSLKYQRPKEIKQAWIELKDSYLIYCVEFNAEEPTLDQDWDSGSDIQYNFIQTTVLKKNIAGIDIGYTVDPHRWRVLIAASGFQNDIKCWFKKKEDAEKLYHQIKYWLLK